MNLFCFSHSEHNDTAAMTGTLRLTRDYSPTLFRNLQNQPVRICNPLIFLGKKLDRMPHLVALTASSFLLLDLTIPFVAQAQTGLLVGMSNVQPVAHHVLYLHQCHTLKFGISVCD